MGTRWTTGFGPGAAAPAAGFDSEFEHAAASAIAAINADVLCILAFLLPVWNIATRE
jgi:hypothetical protein